ncbi:MAG: NAD(P)H-dependent oxidoreductase [Promethearchaeia archaeon]
MVILIEDGNLATLLNWVLEGCKDAGAKVELINVIDHNILYCQECHACTRSGDFPINNDMIEILTKLINCGGIVVGSPE